MTNEEQMLELLREIRDLQRDHFERYREHTERIWEAGRQQELERQQREAANQVELRKGIQGMWVILAVALLIFFFMRPLGDWLLMQFSR